MKNGSLKVFSGTSNPALAESIGEALGIPLGEITVKRFKDGEIYVAYEENVRGTDCFLIQSTCEPVNAMLMELLIMVDAARRASASRITAVLPYYGYGRQDRKHRPRVAITAKLVATLLATAGADRVLTMDLHAGQIQGFFDIPLDNLYATSVLVEEIRKLDIEALTVVSPDLGSVKRARAVARFLEAPLAIIDKRRPKENVSEVMNIIGDVEGRSVLLVDDMIDTAGTICQAASALKKKGALEVYGMATHPVLSGEAVERIEASPFKKLLVTDTIPLSDEKKIEKIQVVGVGHLLAEAIDRIHNETTVSSLFLKFEDI
ncbi:MAG: ribose-phosphate pyrophosphokinase [Candidatus Omnitrophica bacterium]|nr:ribose-phosphate pyrophosphokinase [Candidatus Omnitrophota bacterium]MCA9426731.1 ribose-phosphate pyrophosphokinase [Candidatus Omnitrophota bacterium]MCA9429939.1 ribose-phosphate pyrophosphokinase [Candidatus Omnitrophota bacterium]MCA9439622.1 ribose-phosphate pyrophosphokinase [Candidatus Omnitrophota bacterium]MCB9770027.1 ribose-phosphate pyrophosphokinase [Candidatus Omnitrophota bacterium]